jgi:hypothetical protein
MGTKHSVIRYALFIALLVPAMTFMGCEVDGDYKSVPYGVRGTWECTEAELWYVPGDYYPTWVKGKLIITSNSVTISGPSQHLKNFTRDIAIEAYVEDSQLYIKDKGVWQSPIAYTRWSSTGNSRIAMLTLSGGDGETLKRIED